LNLNATAFISSGWDKDEAINYQLLDSTNAPERKTIRWYSATTELPLCGHGTLAASKVLFTHLTPLEQREGKKTTTIQFETKKKGRLGATINWENGLITLDLPSHPCQPVSPFYKDKWGESLISAILGSEEIELCDIQYSPGMKILLLRLKDELGKKGLQKVCPDVVKMLEIDTKSFIKTVIVTVKGENVEWSDEEVPHFYSRFFAPWEGINEDPIAGLAHTVLTPYWTTQLCQDGEITNLFAVQLSQRGGEMHCLLQGNRVLLSGIARTTMKGQLCC